MSYTTRFKAYTVAVWIGHYTEMHVGEVCGLARKDVNLENCTISITKSLFYNKMSKEWQTKPTNTLTSNSVIPIHATLKGILTEWFRDTDSEYVLCDNDATQRITPKLIESVLHNISRKYNERITYHMLNHTYTTTLYNCNIDLKTAQMLLRHKDFNTATSIYTHLDKEKLNSAVDDVFSVQKMYD